MIGVAPRDCIVFEDALSGIESSFAAGIGTVVAIGPNEQRKNPEGRKEVDLVIGNINEFDRALLK